MSSGVLSRSRGGCVRRRVTELEGVIESLRESNARLEAEVADLTRSSATGTPQEAEGSLSPGWPDVYIMHICSWAASASDDSRAAPRTAWGVGGARWPCSVQPSAAVQQRLSLLDALLADVSCVHSCQLTPTHRSDVNWSHRSCSKFPGAATLGEQLAEQQGRWAKERREVRAELDFQFPFDRSSKSACCINTG